MFIFGLLIVKLKKVLELPGILISYHMLFQIIIPMFNNIRRKSNTLYTCL